MSNITKKQKKLQELLADFAQPVRGREALTKLQMLDNFDINKVIEYKENREQIDDEIDT